MKLADELNKLNENIPESKLDHNDIYNQAGIKKPKTNKGLILIPTGLLLCVFSFLIFLFTLRINDNNEDNKKFKNKLLNQPVLIDDNEINDEEYKEFVTKYDAFCGKLSTEYINYSKELNMENVCLSPLSIFINLSTLVYSVDDDSKNEILNSLDMTEDLLDNCLIRFINKNINDTENFKESIVNTLWIDDSVKIKKDGIKELSNNTYCYPYYVDFESDKTNKDIKDFISKQTNGLIEYEPNFGTDVIMSFINTFYLKSLWWKELFEDNPKDFTNCDLSTTNLVFYSNDYLYESYIQEDGYRHYRMFGQGGIKISFIVPNNGNKVIDYYNNDVINHVTKARYSSEIRNGCQVYTKCVIPQFEASSNLELSTLFKSKLGISKVFEPGIHFSKIADDFTMKSELYHDSKLTVTNKGIEGAAVTTNFYYGSGEGIIYDNFVVDRDFAFVISNNDDEILFSGIIDRL